MAFSSQDTAIIYIGNAVDDEFAIPFSFVESAQITAELWDVTDPLNPVKVTPFNNPAQWSVDGTNVLTTSPVPADHELLIFRKSDDAHSTNYNQYNFPFATVNNDLDKVYQLIQEIREQLKGVIGLSEYEIANGTLPPTIDSINDALALAADLAALELRVDQLELDMMAAQLALADDAADILDLQNDLAALSPQTVAPDYRDLTGQPAGTGENGDVILLKAGAAPFALTLAAAQPIGSTVKLKFLGYTGVVTVTPAAGNIDGQASKQLNSLLLSSHTFEYTGSEWIIV